MIIEITADDITNGIRQHHCECPLALALKRATGNLWLVWERHVEEQATGRVLTVPSTLRRWINLFDAGVQVPATRYFIPLRLPATQSICSGQASVGAEMPPGRTRDCVARRKPKTRRSHAMLVLNRRSGESIVIDVPGQPPITIRLRDMGASGKASLAISAGVGVGIWRQEIWDAMRAKATVKKQAS